MVDALNTMVRDCGSMIHVCRDLRFLIENGDRDGVKIMGLESEMESGIVSNLRWSTFEHRDAPAAGEVNGNGI